MCFASRWRECFSDQHYFATVLSFKGLENETFCHASIINSGGDASKPRMFPLESVNPDECVLLPGLSTVMLRCLDVPLHGGSIDLHGSGQQIIHAVLVHACVGQWTCHLGIVAPQSCQIMQLPATSLLFTGACSPLFPGCAHSGRQRRQSAGTRWQQS